MAESVVTIAAERLGDLLVQEAKFLHGVSGQIELIQLELELMQTYLEDADKRQIQDKRVLTWISKIRETAYDVEDILETFILKIASRRRGGIKNAFKRYACILNEAAELHKVGSQIEDIKTRITTLTRCLQTYGIKHIREGEEGPSSVIERQRQWRQSYSHVDEEYTVGLEGDIKKLVEELLNEEKQCRVVSICGMGGLGKTTLAKKIYRHRDIRRHFDCFAWAFISQQCRPRNIWEGILFELISPSKEKREEIQKYTKAEEAEMLYENERKKIKDMSDDKVAEKLFHVQQEKKCLVIIDDIWTPGDWDILRPAFPLGNSDSPAFPLGNSGSKILLTSRNTDVAVHVDPRGYLHKPRCLTEEEGWSLLQKKAFREGTEYAVGLEGDIKKLVEELLNEEKQRRVVSICGMGGLGKTTLAKKIYHHKDIRHHFDCFAWAFISQQCQPRNIWEGILFELISPSKEQREEILKSKDAEVAEKLYQVQKKKKCLVILDDIWTMEAWDSLRRAFPLGNSGSKILLTTRNKEVAVHADSEGYLHQPQFPTEEEGWSDVTDGKIDEVMEKLGREMVKRCGFLPLAIAVLGGILATKRTKDEWKKVHDNINSYLRSGKGHEQQQPGVNEILSLSYDELPYQLKPCFLYLGHFPEDFNIPTKKLFRMWVAEGLVSSMQYKVKGTVTLEEVAKCYLEELLNRNMVQVGERGSTGSVKTCRLHDLMRNVCLSKANEENFLENQDGNELMGGSLSSMVTNAKLSHRIRRIAIQLKEDEDENFSLKRERAPYLRCLRSLLVIHNNEYHIRLNKKIKFCDFKLLKVLDLERCRIEKLPRVIGDLVHLRYLSIGETKIPSSIGNLRGLQTLIIKGSIDGEVPNVIWKMERLRHLCLPPHLIIGNWRHLCLPDLIIGNRGKLRLGNLRELRTLKNFDARNFDVKELTKLTSLRTLKVNYLRSLKELEGALPISPSDSLNIGLRSLHIELDPVFGAEETDPQGLYSSCHQLRKLLLNGKIVKLLEYSKFPPNLTKLSLRYSTLKEDPMPTLEKLPHLTVLRLGFDSFKGNQMTCSANGFPQLKYLLLSILRYLEEWCVQEEAMCSLCKLEIECCNKLKMVPDGLRSITTLREVHISGMPEEFQKRVKEGGEDYDKLKHVPSIILG